MAKAKVSANVAGQRLPLERRVENYRADGHVKLTPKQLRRAAHKAKIKTDEVIQKVGE